MPSSVRSWSSLAALVLVLAGAAPSLAEPPDDAQQTIENRIMDFRDMGAAFKGVGDQLRSGRPSVARIQAAAGVIRSYARALPSWFPPGSQAPSTKPSGFLGWICAIFPCGDGGAGPQTYRSHARPEIWTQPARFRAASQKLSNASEAFWQASRGGDLATIRRQYGALDGACRACHDAFREKMR